MQAYHDDNRMVMTLDAGGTNFVFSAVQGCEEIVDHICYSSSADDLKACLNNITNGFEEVMSRLSTKPVAISLSFPGPADYDKGIIGDLPNLPAFRGGVALGPMLEDQFELPVFINNDGALFALGEAVSGFLPRINNQLEEKGIDRKYQNLIGVTIGTGLGGGLVINEELCKGDNTAAGGMWLLRSKLHPQMNAEEGASIRAVQRNYAKHAGLETETSSPREIFEIGMGQKEGNQQAAQKAFELLGKELGNALANAATLIDGLVVIGGGLSGAHELFLPAMIEKMNGEFATPDGEGLSRLTVEVHNLEKDEGLNGFLKQKGNEIAVPCSNRKVNYNARDKLGIGISQLGTSKAVSIGAYHTALSALDQKNEQEKLLKF